MPAKYLHTTRALFKTVLFTRLGDLDRIYWTDDEANTCINEALRTFGGIAQNWKKNVFINIPNSNSADSVWFDITEDLQFDQEVTAFEVDVQTLLDQINFHLIENITTLNPESPITSLAEILNFIKNAINEYQMELGLTITRTVIDMAAPPSNIIPLSDEVLDLIRIAFRNPLSLDAPNVSYRLYKEDIEGISLGASDFNTPSTPIFYEQLIGDATDVRLYPPPANFGRIDLLSVNGVGLTTVFTVDTIIKVANNLSHYIKWKVLHDIFSKDGIGNDPLRAAYCLQRWNEGLVIGKNYTSILYATLNDKTIRIDSIANLDLFDRGWQNQLSKPFCIGTAGNNIVAINRRPLDIYSLGLQCVTNAYLPADNADFIDVSEEYIDPLLDYCVHLMSLKDGNAGLTKTQNLYDKFIKAALGHNSYLAARGISFDILMKHTKRQYEEELREVGK